MQNKPIYNHMNIIKDTLVDYYENIGLRLDTVGDLRCNIWYILMQAVAGLGDEEGSLSISSAKRWLSVEKCRLTIPTKWDHAES